MEYKEGMYNRRKNQADSNKIKFNNQFGEKWALANCSEMLDSEMCEKRKKAAHEYAMSLFTLKNKASECRDIFEESQSNPFIESNFASCVEQLEGKISSFVDKYYEIFQKFD